MPWPRSFLSHALLELFFLLAYKVGFPCKDRSCSSWNALARITHGSANECVWAVAAWSEPGGKEVCGVQALAPQPPLQSGSTLQVERKGHAEPIGQVYLICYFCLRVPHPHASSGNRTSFPVREQFSPC